MKTLHYILLIYLGLLLPTIPVNAQKITGNVLDKTRGETLPFVQIGVKGKSIGVLSDKSGFFSLQLEEISSNDSLIFAYLGYEKTVFSCAELLTNSKQKIYLRKETYQLPKVELVSKSLTKYKKIGHPRTTSKNITAGWLSTPTKNYQRPLGERGTLVKLKNKQALLKTLYFHIVNTGYDSLLFRIHLYKFENGIPKKEITKTNIWAKTTEKKGWVTVPLETYNILVEEDFVASIEWIKAWTSKEKEKGSLVLSSGIIGGNLYARNYYHLASNWIKRKNFHIGIYIDAKTN